MNVSNMKIYLLYIILALLSTQSFLLRMLFTLKDVFGEILKFFENYSEFIRSFLLSGTEV